MSIYCKIRIGDNMNNLKSIRKNRKLSQLELSEAIGLPQTTYSRYERGTSKLDSDTLVKLSEYYNVSTDYLLGLIEIPLTSEQAIFIKKIQQEEDPEKIAEEFEVLLGDRVVTGKELLELLNTMKKLDEAVHGDFFKKK